MRANRFTPYSFSNGKTAKNRVVVPPAQELEQRGVDLIDVSSGIGDWRRPEGRSAFTAVGRAILRNPSAWKTRQIARKAHCESALSEAVP